MMIQRPAPLPLPDLRQIPALVWLTDPMHRRWIVWRWVWNNKLGKWDKPPFQINGSHAASDDPETWVDYDTAVAEVEAGRFDGVGLMLHGLPAEYLAAIDLDNVRDPATGKLLPWAQTLVTTSRSYCEVTPSGCGIRILGTAKGIDTLHRNGPHPDGGRFELFLNCKRYITVSGQQIGTSELADDTAQIVALQTMLGQAPRPATNGQTTHGIDRSLEFFRALRTLKGHGHSEAQVLAALEAVGKYGGRLGTEFARAWGKLGGATPQEEPPADRWPSEPQAPASEAPAQPRKGGRIITGDAFMGAHTPPLWLVDGIIQRGRLYALTSLTAHGKTAVALYLACMIHAGRLVGSLDSFKGNVLYLAGENPSDLAARMLGMCRHYRIPSLNTPYVLPAAFPLNDEQAKALKEQITAMGVEFALIIGDTAASFFPGEDENDNVQAGSYARTWRTLSECPGNPAIIPLCHPVKHAARDNLLPRGGGAFLNELDGNLTLWSPEIGEITSLHWQGKIRGPDFAPFNFRLIRLTTGLQDDRDRDEVTVIAEPLPDDEAANQAKQATADEDAVLKALHDHPDWSLNQIARDIGWTNNGGDPEKWKVQRAIQGLADDKLIRQKRKRAPWTLTKEGQEALASRYPEIAATAAATDRLRNER